MTVRAKKPEMNRVMVGGDNGAGGFGNDIIDPLVDIAQSKYAEDDGNDRTGIVEHRDGQDACKHKVADLACLAASTMVGYIRVAAMAMARYWLVLNFFCGRCGNEERQEGKTQPLARQYQ